MNDDSPIVKEVRAIRHKIAQECGNDIRKIIAHANEVVAQWNLKKVPATS